MGLVLVVDDHLSVAKSLVRLLAASGFAAQAVHSGAEALAFLRGQAVGLVVLDLAMPDMSGLDVLRALSADDGGVAHGPGGRPPVVLYSGHFDDAIRDEALRLGAIDVIPKIESERLLTVVAAHIRRT